MARGVIAVDIGGTVVKAAFVSEAAPTEVQGRTQLPVGSGDAEDSFDAVAHTIHDVEKFAASEGVEIVAYGVTAPGPTDAGRNIATKPQLGWQNFPLRARLREELQSDKIVIQNDANAAAYGCWAHRQRDDESLLLVTVSTGIGGGLVLPGGVVLDGATGNGAEVGHAPFGDYECEFRHGVGCIEGSVSGSAIKARFGINPRHANRDLRREVAKELGTALVGMIAMYDPSVLVFMGSVAYGFEEADAEAGYSLDERFTGSIKARIKEVSVNHRDIDVLLSPFKDDTGIVGVAALALRL